MDELPCGNFSSFSPQSPSSSSGTGGQQHPAVLEFDEYCDVPEQWLEDDDSAVEKLWDATATALGNGATPSAPATGNDASDKPAAPAPKGRRGRKPGPRTAGPVLSHVEAERQRRDRLNSRFCDLRAAVPTVSKMDRASLLADATAYIAELRARAELLEIEAKQKASSSAAAVTAGPPPVDAFKEEKVEVRMLGQREAAMLRLTTTAATPHAAARLMVALWSLDLPVQHACVCRVGGTTTVQDAVVDVPVALRDEGLLRAVLLQSLQLQGRSE